MKQTKPENNILIKIQEKTKPGQLLILGVKSVFFCSLLLFFAEKKK